MAGQQRSSKASDPRGCGFARRTSVNEALSLLVARVGRLASEPCVAIEAEGRVAAAPCIARAAVPHFDRSMMDGFAVVAESTFGASEMSPRRLRLVGEVRAGQAGTGRAVGPGEAVAITTGAPIPAGADAVLMVENTRRGTDGDVLATADVSPGKHIGRRGEDIEEGSVIVEAGRLLRPQDLGVLASSGVASVEVVRRPRVRIVVTGNELLEPGAMPSGARIVDSNSVVLAALVRRDGAVVAEVRRAEDDRAVVAAALRPDGVDAVLVSGGSSVGPEDHAPQIVAEIGELAVHGLAMRPSSPAGFGFIDGRAVFLLPGNPVSCLCAYEFFAGPSLRALGGRGWDWPHRRQRAPLASKIVSSLGRTDFMRVTVDEGGVHPLMVSGASILSSTTRADGVVIVPEEREGFAAGEEVEVLLF